MRRRRPDKRKILPDPIYGDLQIAKFMNYLMSGGKKGTSEEIFYGAMSSIKSRIKKEGVESVSYKHLTLTTTHYV